MPFTTNSSIIRQDQDKASFSFSINNFPDAKRTKKTGEKIESEIFSIMASRLNVSVYPSGRNDKDSGFVSVYLRNVSNHTVTVDYTLTVGNLVLDVKSRMIESKEGKGLPQFIKTSEVGQDMVVTAEVTRVKEEIIDEAVGNMSLASWQLMKKSEAENLQKLELKMEQKLEQKLENYVEKKLKHSLKEELNKLDQKINLKFEDLKEDIKAPARAPECPICFEELKPPMKIIQCLKGHKLCEPCSQKPDIVSCPGACKSAFMGRDFGMEAFLLEQFQTRWVIKT